MSNRQSLLGKLTVQVHFDPDDMGESDADEWGMIFSGIDWRALVMESMLAAGIDTDQVNVSIVEG